MPGYEVHVLDEGGHEVKPRAARCNLREAALAPRPACQHCGTPMTVSHKSYLSHFPGYYETADAGYMDEEGYLYIMARTDDIINVAGHRLSTGGMEEILASHPNVAECAVLGIADQLKGQLPLGFIVLKSGVNRDAAVIEKECVKLVRDKIGAVAALKTVITIPRLPKTRSGKILRGTIRKMADKEEFKMPATIDDPAILMEIGAAMKKHGIGV